MQLLHEPEIRIRDAPLAFNVVHRLERRPAVVRHEKRSDDTDTAAYALRAMHKDARFGVRSQCIVNEGCGARQVRSKLRKWQVLHADLHPYGLHGEERRRRAKDVVRQRREDVRNAVRRKESWVLGEREVRDVEPRNYFRDILCGLSVV